MFITPETVQLSAVMRGCVEKDEVREVEGGADHLGSCRPLY